MPEIKITTEELWNEARSLSAIAVDIGRISVKNSTAINKMEESCSFMTVAGIYAGANQLISRFSTLMQNLTRVATKAMNCAQAYEESNEELKKEFEDWFESVQVNTINGVPEADYWKNSVGSTLANIDGKWYKEENISYTNGYEGECTWYAYGRFYETTGIKLKTAKHAYTWLDNNKDDNRLDVTYGHSVSDLIKQKIPCIAVAGPNKYSSVGHVSIIEKILYNEDGTIKSIFITQSNADSNHRYDAGVDGVVKELTGDAINNYLNGLSGFICAK